MSGNQWQVIGTFLNNERKHKDDMWEVVNVHFYLIKSDWHWRFATTVTLSNGVPIESVSKMLGHADLRTTQHYAKVLDKKISEDMKGIRSKFSGPNELSN